MWVVGWEMSSIEMAVLAPQALIVAARRVASQRKIVRE
jgi:hypothetical protein